MAEAREANQESTLPWAYLWAKKKKIGPGAAGVTAHSGCPRSLAQKYTNACHTRLYNVGFMSFVGDNVCYKVGS